MGRDRSPFFPATAMPDTEWWRALWPHPENVIAALGIDARMRVVDLCCGDGWFTVPIARLASHVVAIDLDPCMLDLARAKLRDAGLDKCDLIEGDAYEVAQLVNEPADYLLMANTFHGVPDKQRLARAMAAVLKPRGRIAIINWHRRSRDETTVLGQPRGPSTEMRMEPADVAATVKSSALTLTEVIELPPYHYAAIFAKRGPEPLSMERAMDGRDERTAQSGAGRGCCGASQGEPKAEEGSGKEGSGMAMGMEMAKKMMAQMGHDAPPFEMMQKMMAQMSEAGKPPAMDKMMGMGMCSEMLNAIRQTNALAVHGTPELQQAFGEWLKVLEGKAETLLAQGPQDAAGLAKSLSVSEASANYILARLAQGGKITLTGKSKS